MKSDKPSQGQRASLSEDQLVEMVKNLAFLAEEMVVLAFSDHPLTRVVTFDSDQPTDLEHALRWRDPDFRWAFPVFQLRRGRVDRTVASIFARFDTAFVEAGLKPQPALLAAWLLSPMKPRDGIRQIERADDRNVEEAVRTWTESLLAALQPQSPSNTAPGE